MKELKYGGYASYIFILCQTSFTIGTQKSQSNSASYTEVNQASNITSNNLNVSNDALFQADNDFNVNGVAQNSTTRSTNSSSSAAIGGYASTGSGQGASAGITANASRAKGYANSDSVTYANSQLNVGGTTTFDIGNDVNIKGGVINTNRAQGVIGGNVNIESLQDTYTYDSKQKNIGFSADIDIAGGGAGSSLSVNGVKTDITADYKAVGQQSGIFTRDEGAASGVISLALLGAGSAAGLDTASTVTATNVDANNRQLHTSEIQVLNSVAKKLAKSEGGTEEYWNAILYAVTLSHLDSKGAAILDRFESELDFQIRGTNSQLLGSQAVADWSNARLCLNTMIGAPTTQRPTWSNPLLLGN